MEALKSGLGLNPVKQNMAADVSKGCYDDFLTDTCNPDYVTSPPPAYNKGSIWTTPKSNLRSPTGTSQILDTIYSALRVLCPGAGYLWYQG
jgi:hypothetical protein